MDNEVRLDPSDYGISATVRSVPLPKIIPAGDAGDEIMTALDPDALAASSAEAGLQGLAGVDGPVRVSVVYGAALCLCQLGLESNTIGASEKVRSVLDSGEAARRFEAAIQ